MEKLPDVKTSRETYKGHKLLVVENGSGRPFKFGRKKALLMLAALEDIKQFVEDTK